jgi:hypothetical protein
LAFPWELPVWTLNLALLLAAFAYRRGRTRLSLVILLAGLALGMTVINDIAGWGGPYQLELGYWVWLATPMFFATAPVLRIVASRTSAAPSAAIS